MIVINSTNINKTKESLNTDGQQFTNINKTKESLSSDSHQFHQYQQDEQWHLILTELTEHKKDQTTKLNQQQKTQKTQTPPSNTKAMVS